MLLDLIKYSALPVGVWLGLVWLSTPTSGKECEECKKRNLKKAPEGCNVFEPWDPNFVMKKYETIEERQRVAEGVEMVHRGIEKMLVEEECTLSPKEKEN